MKILAATKGSARNVKSAKATVAPVVPSRRVAGQGQDGAEVDETDGLAQGVEKGAAGEYPNRLRHGMQQSGDQKRNGANSVSAVWMPRISPAKTAMANGVMFSTRL